MVESIKSAWNNGGRLNVYQLGFNVALGLLLAVAGWSINSTLATIRQDIAETRAMVSELKHETESDITALKGEHRADVCRLDSRIDRAEDRLNVIGGVKWKP